MEVGTLYDVQEERVFKMPGFFSLWNLQLHFYKKKVYNPTEKGRNEISKTFVQAQLIQYNGIF